MPRLYRALVLVALLGCKKHAAEPSHMSKALEQVGWMRGDWIAQTGLGEEHWIAVGGALYGIAFAEADRFEVMVIDDAAGPGRAGTELRLYAMPGGKTPVEFQAIGVEKSVAKFANPKHDFPTQIVYRLEETGVMRADASNAARNEQITFARAATANHAPELEELDRAYAKDTADRGFVGWNAGREQTGWIIRGDERLEGEAIRTRIKPLLDNGTMTWTPLASGTHGTLGYTVGTATVKPRTGQSVFRTSYVRIWAKQADATWKVRFDTDRWINE
jgi:hypothetical protein